MHGSTGAITFPTNKIPVDKIRAIDMKNEFEMEIDVQGLFLHLMKKAKRILVMTLLCTGLALLVSCLLPPKYTASTRIYVLNRERGIEISYSDYQIANQMIEDYKVLITGANITQEVIRELELPMTREQLEKMIHLEAPKDTRFLEISITADDPGQAVAIANMVREIACEEIKRIMDVEAVNLVYEAEMPREPSGPPIGKITILSGLAALFLMALYYAVRYVMDDSIRTEEDVEAYLGLHVLAVIPNSEKMNRQKGIAASEVRRRKPQR